MMPRKLTTLLMIGASIAAPALAQEAGPSGSGVIMQQLLFFVPLIAIFYFLLIRPQQQRQKRHTAMLDSVDARRYGRYVWRLDRQSDQGWRD